MRKFLLASVATLGTTGGLMGAALAQTPPGAPVPQPPMSAPVPISGPIGAPNQGQQAWPAAPAPVAYVNSQQQLSGADAAGRVGQSDAWNHRRSHQRQGAGGCRRGVDQRRYTCVHRAERRAGSAADHQHRQRAIGCRYRHVREHGAECHPGRQRHRHGQAATAGHRQLRRRATVPTKMLRAARTPLSWPYGGFLWLFPLCTGVDYSPSGLSGVATQAKRSRTQPRRYRTRRQRSKETTPTNPSSCARLVGPVPRSTARVRVVFAKREQFLTRTPSAGGVRCNEKHRPVKAILVFQCSQREAMETVTPRL